MKTKALFLIAATLMVCGGCATNRDNIPARNTPSRPRLLLSNPSPLAQAGGTSGFLVFEIDRYEYNAGTKVSEVRQRFKVPLTERFLSNFKNGPSQHSAGTGFYCNGADLKTDTGSTRFMWWIRKTADGRWAVNMWGSGVETIDGRKEVSRNPCATQSLVIRRWADLDMRYMLSYVNGYHGLNVSFQAKYLPSKRLRSLGPVPTALVNKADGSLLFKPGNSAHYPIELHCGFQEG